MAAKYSDAEIATLLAEKKPLSEDFRSKMRLRNKRGHQEQELDIQGVSGNSFRLILRKSSFNALDFSIILAHCPAGSNQIFRLRRYNGKSHEHTNTIESDKFFLFMSTLQRNGIKILEREKMLTRNRQRSFRIFILRYNAC